MRSRATMATVVSELAVALGHGLAEALREPIQGQDAHGSLATLAAHGLGVGA
jgi:hypothetical protein